MLLHRVTERFGPTALGHALFYNASSALRFELAGDGRPVDQFSQAYDRARHIAHAALGTSEELTAVLACFFAPEHATLIRGARLWD